MVNSTIQKQDTKEIDFDNSQILKAKNESLGLIILTNGKHCTNQFSGTIIFSKNPSREVGDFFDNWTKEGFIVFDSSITLINN